MKNLADCQSGLLVLAAYLFLGGAEKERQGSLDGPPPFYLKKVV
jgi:hypothetical protein